MAMTEHEGLQIYKDASGNSFILYPITKAHLVDGFEEAVMALAGIEDGLAKFAHAHAAGDIKTGVLPIERGGTGGNTAAAALEALGVPAAISAAVVAFGAAKIEVGSYVGRGVYGTYQYNSLDFSFNPKLLIISSVSARSDFLNTGFFFYPEVQAANTMYTSGGDRAIGCAVTWGDKHIDWSSTWSAASQLNVSGVTYRYIAIG